jgi:hypothetical protein
MIFIARNQRVNVLAGFRVEHVATRRRSCRGDLAEGSQIEDLIMMVLSGAYGHNALRARGKHIDCQKE